MAKVEPEDLAILYDKAWKQFQEDRDAVMKQYADLRAYIDSDNGRYAISGDTLAKYAELMIKQTGQIVELIKLAKKDTDGESSLSDADFEHINKRIEEEQAKKEKAKELVEEEEEIPPKPEPPQNTIIKEGDQRKLPKK